MNNEPYSDRVRALFASPVHAGDVDGGLRVSAEGQGVRIALAASCRDGKLAQLRFKAWGCPHLIAAAEAFCARYEGLAASALDDFAARDLAQTLPVPAHKMSRILVLEDAARSLGQSVRQAPDRGQGTD